MVIYNILYVRQPNRPFVTSLGSKRIKKEQKNALDLIFPESAPSNIKIIKNFPTKTPPPQTKIPAEATSSLKIKRKLLAGTASGRPILISIGGP